MNTTTELIPLHTLETFCQMYEAARLDMVNGFALLNVAEERIKPHLQYFTILRHDSEAGALDQLMRKTWCAIIDRTRVRDAMAPQRRRLLDEQLEKGSLPPIEFGMVVAFLEGLSGDLATIVAESIEAAARILRREDGYKTNGDGWSLGQKAITPGSASWEKYCSRFDLSYHRDGDINAVDNAFHLLDGKGPIKHPDTLATKIRQAMQDRQQECTTDYFRVKWFKNGNIHWEFRRLDLVDELNRRAADHRSLRRPAVA